MNNIVLSKIDIENPYFERTLTRISGNERSKQILKLWLPIQMDNGGWVTPVTITGIGLQPVSIMPGEDPLDSLIMAVAFARDMMERAEGDFLFGERNRATGGLPSSLEADALARSVAGDCARWMTP